MAMFVGNAREISIVSRYLSNSNDSDHFFEGSKITLILITTTIYMRNNV